VDLTVVAMVKDYITLISNVILPEPESNGQKSSSAFVATKSGILDIQLKMQY
jgi:hypothetical protein